MEGKNGKGEGEAVIDQPPQPLVDDTQPASPPSVGNCLPPVPPAPAALDDHSSSLPKGLPQISVRAADDSMYSNGAAGSGSGRSPAMLPRHRRSQSEVVIRGPKLNNSLQTFKSQIQRAWKWGGSSKEKNRQFNFNPEVLANQKRQWYQLQSKTPAYARKKKWELAMARTLVVKHEHWFPSPASLEPQVLFKYPPGNKLPVRSKDLCAFCFPGGVEAQLVEKTPSLSDLTELVYGQGHLGRDDSAFVFSLKVADSATLYGVCLLVPEIVQRPPGILGGSSPLCHPVASRFLVSAPRCYCLLTRVPFFELHFEMLNSIVSQDHFNRITQFVNEINVTGCTPSIWKSPDHFTEVDDSPFRDSFTSWMSSAIPVDSAVVLSAAAAGIITDNKVIYSSIKTDETQSPPSSLVSQDKRENSHFFDDHASDVVEHPGCERSYENFDNGTCSPGPSSLSHSRSKLECSASSISLFSSARSLEDEVDVYFSNNEIDFSGDFVNMDWAKENENDFVKIVSGYNALPIPARGSEIVFHPVENLPAIQYRRPAVSELGLEADLLAMESQDPSVSAEVSAKLAAAEEADALSVWTIATICRSLSLDNIVALVTGVLLEKQVVITCPNLGILSATVLSLIPMIRPFEWQSLLLPVLPEKLLDFLDAPVPFLVGIQQRPVDFTLKNPNLIYIDVFKDQRKACDLPLLPRHNGLFAKLHLIHARLISENSIAQKQHVYRCTEAQAEAATQFLVVMRWYLESLCADLRSNTITSVEPNNDRVSVLLKDSFVDSFPEDDQPFMKMFIETQMFSVLSDSRLSRYEHENNEIC